MTRYYFDLRDDDGLVVDNEGVELADMDAVQKEATQTMVNAAGEMLQRPVKSGETVIEVRNDGGHVMRARFAIDIERTN